MFLQDGMFWTCQCIFDSRKPSCPDQATLYHAGKKKTIWWWQILDKLFLLVIHIMLITSSHIVCCWLHVFFQANLLSLCFASLSFSCFNKYLGLAYILPSRSKREYCHGTGHHVSYLTCKNSVINNLKCHFFAKQTWWQLSRCINFLEISNLS